MKNTKDFFGVLLSVLVCVFLVGLAVYAATTIGLDVSIDDDLTITGNTIVFGNAASISNTDTDLLLITETLISFEGKVSISQNLNVQSGASVSESLWVDGSASVSDGFRIGISSATITGGTASATGSCVQGSIYLRSGTASAAEAFLICEQTNVWTTFASSSLGE